MRVPSDWFESRKSWDFFLELEGEPLLHVHGLMFGLERRITDRLVARCEDAEVLWEDFLYGGELEDEGAVPKAWLTNFDRIRRVCQKLEQAEIGRLINGRAA